MSFQPTNDDPAAIIQFRFIDVDGKLSKTSLLSALKPPYPIKYYINGVLITIALTVFLLWNYGVIPGPKLGFFCNDPLFSHKYNGDTISATTLGIGLGFLLPIIYFIVEYVRMGKFKEMFSRQSLAAFYLYLKHCSIGLLLAGGVTELAKTIVGEHRPHFFYTCMPDTNINCTNGMYISTYTCTNPDVSYLDLVDSSRSFPSGHSSMSWFMALYSAYVIHSRLPVHKTGSSFKVFMLVVCLTFGLTCSLTRITDRRHHWWDVLVGTVIGIIGAAYSIRLTEEQIRILKEEEEEEEAETNVLKFENNV